MYVCFGGQMGINVKLVFHDPDLYAHKRGQTGVSVKLVFHDPDLYAHKRGQTGVNVKRGFRISEKCVKVERKALSTMDLNPQKRIRV